MRGGPFPRYPGTLRQKGIEGEARVDFVVDVTGRADPSTLRVVSYTHIDFANAVTDVVPKMKFIPARVGSCPVRMHVELPFVFNLPR